MTRIASRPYEGSLLTVDEVADFLHVHPSTVRRHIHDGELPACRVGSQLRIYPEALERYLAASTAERQAA